VSLATFYNIAWLGIEANNHGISTNKAAIRTGYQRLYEQQIIDERFFEPTDKIGWHTNQKTRPEMLDELEQAIREGNWIDPDETSIMELLTFVRNDKGKPEAQEGCFDDQVMASAICLQMHLQCPMSGIKTEAQKRMEQAKHERLSQSRVQKRRGR
jgi:hypothetical protein